MKALVLSDLWVPFPGGAERHLFNLARELMWAGHDVEVVTGYAPAQQFDGPPLTMIDDVRREQLGEILAAAVDNSGADVVVAHQFYATHFPSVAQGRPFVQLVYNGQRQPTADLALYISSHIARQQHHPGPDDLVLRPTAYPADVVAQSGSWDAVGFVKPLPHKNPQLVYQLARRMPTQRFVVLRGEWQPLEDVDGAPANVEFMEPVEDIREFWSQVSVVLMPSLSEDAGTVPIEAALNRVPCLSSNVGGLIETNAGGLALDPGDVDGWESWLRFMLLDGSERNQVVERQVERMLPSGMPAAVAAIAKVAAR